jgi:signal transduction histidine kinase
MGQVFSNLIGNALQYSPDNTAIAVSITGQGDRVLIAVHNEGDPIPLGEQKTIFKSLTRGGEWVRRRWFHSPRIGAFYSA